MRLYFFVFLKVAAEIAIGFLGRSPQYFFHPPYCACLGGLFGVLGLSCAVVRRPEVRGVFGSLGRNIR